MAASIIPVVLACDNNYVAHLAVVIRSILANKSGHDAYHFYVLDGGIENTNKVKLIDFVKAQASAEISFLDVTKYFSATILTTLPVATFLRLVLPQALPELDKIVYLDTDIVVMKDIAALYAEDISDLYIAAVEDVEINHFIRHRSNIHLGPTPYKDQNWYIYAANVLGLAPTNPRYFNAGVAVYNLALMRTNHITERLMDFLDRHQPLALCDQDVLNAVLQDKKKLLDPRWNVKLSPLLLSMEKKNQRATPFIAHYRLWAYGVPYADKYWTYLAQTPFAGTVPRSWMSYSWLFQPFLFLQQLKRTMLQALRSGRAQTASGSVNQP